ncbi:hypothetical protein [Streptomyces xinghaiensis]|uniref:hypothetical protein n=1 Tax=Streptomyces xinghaiensis TaxID=1038928 RepID=UPI001EE140E9|nr:hypothetical protein [Streptomyces xinghaiensis]
MTGPAAPPLKSYTAAPNRPAAAEQPVPAVADRAAKGAARQGARSALRPDPRPSDGRRPIAWLHITAPGRGTVPTATSVCACGRNRSAVGRRHVLALIDAHTAHRTTCPLRKNEGRNAA